MYEWDVDDVDDGSRSHIAAIGVGLAVVAAGWFVGRPAITGGDSGPNAPVVVLDSVTSTTVTEALTTELTMEFAASTAGVAPSIDPAPDAALAIDTESPGSATSSPTTTPSAASTTVVATSAMAARTPTTVVVTTSTTAGTTSTTAVPTSTTAAVTSTTAPPTSTTAAPTSTTAAPTSTTAATSTTTAATSTTLARTTTTTAPTTSTAPATTTTTTTVAGSYVTMPDGAPQPVVAILGDDRITLVGAVPSQSAATAVADLAIATSAFPDLPIDNQLAINPGVPLDLAVRLVELQSAWFAENSDEVMPDRAAQLDRVVDVLNASPHLTLAVVGHTDQRGADEANLQLSRRRAEAVVSYIVTGGIDGGRLSASGRGEADLLSNNDDAASLALNRRLEFIFVGVFTHPPTVVTTAEVTT
jgi:outer membrane protein OmpA-like peptidoglycan-associated protein